MEKQYDLLLLDADGTIFDFAKAEHYAFFETFRQAGLPVDEEVYATYNRINHNYWLMLERGEVAKPDLIVRRFADTLAHYAHSCDPVEINRMFIRNLSEADFLFDGAEELCRDLASRYTIAIATNGVAATQTRRVEKSAIRDYVSHLIISEVAGAEKPDTRFFTYALEQCGVSDKSQVIMIGDSLSADMAGGIAFGVDTCWYNPKGLPAPDDMPITYVANTFDQIKEVLDGKTAKTV